jgi:hypothetical protein
MEFSFTIVVVGLLQDDLGGGVNGVNLLFFDGLDSLDSKAKLLIKGTEILTRYQTRTSLFRY